MDNEQESVMAEVAAEKAALEEKTSEETAEDSQPEPTPAPAEEPKVETPAVEEPADPKENVEPAEEPKVETPEEPKKSSRAQERIREILAENKRLREVQTQSLVQAPPIPQGPQFDGVADDGIDPQLYGQSVLAQAGAMAQQAAQFEAEKAEARQKYNFLETSEVAQLQVSALINQGFTPMQAAEMVSIEREETAKEMSERNSKISQASSQAREKTQLTTAGKTQPIEEEFTEEQVANMPMSEYIKNEEKIMAQFGIKKSVW